MCAGQRPAAEDNRTDGAGSLLIRDVDITALRFFLDGHFGNDGDSHARTNHAEQAAELAAFENDLGMQPRAVAGGDGGVSEAMAVTQQQERIGAEVFQEKRAALAEFMASRKRGEEALGEQRGGFKFVASDGKREDSNVDGTCAEPLEKHGSNLFDDGEPNL